MTLAQLVKAYPSLFYVQSWYLEEPFIHKAPVALPEVAAWSYDAEPHLPVSASDLAAAYVRDPMRTIWRHFLWTDDVDRWGQRVYVAGVGVYGINSFQVHRMLQPKCYFVRAA